jgi:hypothetical protein
MATMGIAIDILGWLGALVVVAAYSLISYGSVDGRSRIYQTLNVIGSILLIVNTAWHRAWPSSVVNLVWVGIAIGALSRGSAVSSAGGGSLSRRLSPRGQQTTRDCEQDFNKDTRASHEG